MDPITTEKGLVGAARGSIATGRGAGATAEPEQLDLGLPAITGPDGSKIVPQPRGPGRPAGSGNIMSRRWREFLLARYPSPLEGITAIASLGVEDISKSLHCTLLEAMKIKLQCLETSASFLYPKLQAVLYHKPGDLRGEDAARLVLSDAVELELTAIQADHPEPGPRGNGADSPSSP